MMCSSWKISVFGIVALMLAFGMVTTDVMAANGTLTITENVDDTTLRAASETTILFSVVVATAPDGDQDKDSTVRIRIPSVWSRPVNSDDTDITTDPSVFKVGEVFITEVAGITGTVSGRDLVASIGKDATGTITFAFKTLAPARAGSYKIPVTKSSVHDTDDAGGGSGLTIYVGPVAAGPGSGELTLTPFKAQADTDDNLPYENQYVVTSEQALTNLQIKFTAKGTIPAGSTITFASGAQFPAFTRANDSTEIAVTGHVDVVRAARLVTTTVKAGGIQKGAMIVFTIKNYKAPKVEAAAIEGDLTITIGSTIAALEDVGGNVDADFAISSAEAFPVFTFVAVKPHGTGKLVLNNDSDVALTNVNTGFEFVNKTLKFTFTDLLGIGDGGKFEFMIPAPWPQPFVPINTASDANGALTSTEGDVSVEGRTVKGALPDSDATATPVVVTYRVDKAPAEGAYTFPAKASSAPHGSPASIASPTLEVTVGSGKGSVVLMQGGRVFNQTTDKAAVGTLTFVFTAAGRMTSGASVTIAQPTTGSWTAFREDNGDGTADPGEVTLSGKANLTVTAGLITATLSETMTAGEKLTFTYKNVTVRDIPDGTTASDTFNAQANSYTGEALGDIPDPNVGIGRAPDGGGSISLSVTQADAGSVIGNLVITYTAAGHMETGSTVEVTVPANGDWPDATEAGRVALSAGTLSTTATTMTAITDAVLGSGDTIVFTYTNITAPSAGGTYTFTGKSTASGGGTLTALSAGATITIDEVAAGSIALASATGPLTSADPGMALGNLTFTFTAGAQMSSGAQVQVTVPVGWTPAFVDNNDGTDAPGEVSLAGAADISVTGGGGTPWILTATTNAVLEVGNTLTITYKMVTAPSAEATYAFTTKASLAASGTLLPLSTQPSVVVRTPVAAIALKAEPSSVFAGGEITLTVDLWSSAGELAKALGAQTVALTSTSETGEFSNDMGTIPDNMSEWTGTYSDNTAGMATLTATLGEMTSSVDVEIKSTIRDLSVNGDTEMALVSQGGTIMVRATGPVGGGTVTVLDSEGQKVGLKKALDPVGEPDADGDQVYSRSVDLPDPLDDGMYTVSVEIQGDVNDSLTISVVNDQTAPVVSNAAVTMAVVANGDTLTISADVAMNESMVDIVSVVADLGGLDSTQESVALDELSSSPGKYFTFITVDANNEAEDGEYTITITATDELENAGSDTVAITLRNDVTPPVLTDAAITPDWALNGDTVTISVNGGESGLTVTADASAIGGAADEMLAEGMDADMMGTGMYSADVEVMGAAGGDQMVSISATDMGGNTTEASASVSIHAVTAASFSPSEVSSGDTIMVSAMGTAGLTGTFSVFDADGNNIVEEKSLTEDAMNAGSYSGSVDVSVAHPPGEYWVSVTIGQASMTAEGALTIEHSAEFTLAIGAGTHLIHVPLNVTHIDGVEGTIDTVGDLYDALGDAVNFIISLGADGSWNSYLGDMSAGGAADAAIGDDTGLIAVMSSAASLTLSGEALGTGGASAINLSAGNNLVGVPLDPAAGLDMISDALAHPAVSAIVVSNAAGNGFNTIAQAGDPGDGAVMGGVGYIVVAAAPASIPVIGMAWDNSMADMGDGGMTASTAPSIGFQTPVLQVQGKLIDEAGMMSLDGLNVTVRNVTRGTTLGSTMTADDYSMTFVKLDSSAAKVGDVLEIKADSPNPLLGIRPVQHVVTADDVRDSRIDLPDLVTYEIPAQTELLANYPNPFNPETWIPFRLAEDSNVSVSIYGASGSLVRTIDIGLTPAAVYEGRSDAIYWDGRNDFGEQVSSGLYFYHLSAGEFSATRRMVIVK